MSNTSNQVNIENNQDNSNSVNYLMENSPDSFQKYKQIPLSSSFKSIKNSSSSSQDINNTQNNNFYNQDPSYTYLTKNKNNKSPLTNENNKINYYYVFSPERKKNEISMAEILSNFNYDKEHPNNISYLNNSNLNSTYEDNLVSIITQNENKYKSRSPTTYRKNHFLINNDETTTISPFYSRSPGPSTNKNRNNNDNIISNYSPERKSLINDISNISNNINNYNNNNAKYIESQTPKKLNNNELINSESTLLYPNYSKKINITNNIDTIYNNDTIEINENVNINKYNKLNDANNIPSYSNNTKYYTTIIPSPPSTEDFINNISSRTYDTIQYSPSNENNANNINSNYQIIPVNDGNFSNYNNNTNELYNNYIVTPQKNNQIQYNSNILNNINTIPNTNKYIQMNLSSPNTINLNSSPTSTDMLISNYYYQNSLSPTSNVVNNNYLSSNQYQPLANPHFVYSKDLNLKENQRSSSIISNFNNNNNLNNQTILAYPFSDKHINNISNTNNISSKKNNNFEIKSSLGNNTNKYINKKIDNNKIENINTNINLIIQPDEYFSQYMFEHINKVRTNPNSFIQNIKSAIQNISYDKRGKLIYKGRLKVALSKGKFAFDEAISDLEKTDPMEPLIFKNDLCVEITNNEKEFKSGDYLRKKINEKIQNGIPIRAFWRDIIKDPEINFLLMIIDDNAIKIGDKRKDILDPEMKYIGINAASLGNKFVCYTVLSDE